VKYRHWIWVGLQPQAEAAAAMAASKEALQVLGTKVAKANEPCDSFSKAPLQFYESWLVS